MVQEARARESKIWDRDPHEWYVEPGRVTRQLLDVERFPGTVYDPCCGRGNIVEAVNTHYGLPKAVGTDLVDRFPEGWPTWHRGTLDFLGDEALIRGADSIVMNPPFGKGKMAEAFIRRALCTARYKVAAFVDVRFLGGKTRAMGFYRERCPNRVWYVTPRPSCPPGTFLAEGGAASGGTADYCWLVYDLTVPAPSSYQGGWLLPSPVDIGARADD